MLDNTLTVNHRYVMFGVRELTANETNNYCSNNNANASYTTDWPITDQTMNFTANYYIRTYLSSCLYNDEELNWKSDGLVVCIVFDYDDSIDEIC